jgi:rare lipoprotein A
MSINRTLSFAGLLVCLVLLLPCSVAPGQSATQQSSGPQTGICVYYSDSFQGRLLASGEKYDKAALTAAHKTLPFGTMVKITNLKNNKSVVVRVNDRGPHGSKERIIEVTRRAAEELDMVKDGKAKVQIEVVKGETK